MNPLPIYSEEQRKILHVLTGPSCNNNCLFCFEEDREGRQAYVNSLGPEIVARMIWSGRDAREILFTCGEPTLNPRLPAYIALARRLGIPTIGLITNGRRLAHQAYLEQLLRLGLSSITVSVHADTAPLHDSLVRTKRAFEQTARGLDNLARLKPHHSFVLRTSSVLCKKNFRRIGPLHSWLSQFPVDKIVFNVLVPDGRGIRHFDRLMPRYSDVADEVRRLAGRLTDDEIRKICVVDIPYCVTARLPAEMRGHVETFVQYEPEGSTGHPRIPHIPVPSSGARFGDRSFFVTSRLAKEAELRSKHETCGACPHDNVCPGVWKPYVERFGWEEFQSPVTPWTK